MPYNDIDFERPLHIKVKEFWKKFNFLIEKERILSSFSITDNRREREYGGEMYLFFNIQKRIFFYRIKKINF